MLVQRKIRDVDYSFLRMIQSNNLFLQFGLPLWRWTCCHNCTGSETIEWHPKCWPHCCQFSLPDCPVKCLHFAWNALVCCLLFCCPSSHSKWQVDCLNQLCASSVCFGLHSSTLCTFSVSRDSFTHFPLSNLAKTQCVPSCFDVSFWLSACHHDMCRKLCSENKNERRMLQSEETFKHMSDRFLSPALPPLAS